MVKYSMSHGLAIKGRAERTKAILKLVKVRATMWQAEGVLKISKQIINEYLFYARILRVFFIGKFTTVVREFRLVILSLF